jgi:hypothetical protein
MSYRCGLCNVVCDRGAPQKRLTVLRADGRIDREVPVCPLCHSNGQKALDAGRTLVEVHSTTVRKDESRLMIAPAPDPSPPPAPPPVIVPARVRAVALGRPRQPN